MQFALHSRVTPFEADRKLGHEQCLLNMGCPASADILTAAVLVLQSSSSNNSPTNARD